MKTLSFILLSLFLISIAYSNDRIEIGIDEQLGKYIPLELIFNDEAGNPVRLGELIDGPTVLSFVYYNCPGICSPLLFETANIINKSALEPGYDYKVISISIDNTETPETASKKKKEMISGIDKDIPAESWRYLTGSGENIKKITSSAGFYFKKERDEFLHAGSLIFIDKNGKICRYLFPGYTEKRGFGILPFDFKMAVLETADSKQSPTIARMLKFCFSYDADGKQYVLNFTRIFGAAILLFAGIFVLIITLRHKKEIIK